MGLGVYIDWRSDWLCYPMVSLMLGPIVVKIGTKRGTQEEE